jgi:hypothetical protein
VISAYKPTADLERSFSLRAGTEAGVWEFISKHLYQLPVIVLRGHRDEPIAERLEYLLFDRMVAFHVQREVSVPLSASQFREGLRHRYPERDGMFFLPEQVQEYDRQRLLTEAVEQFELFVSDEKTAIQWVRQQLADRPMTYQQLSPLYMKEAQRVWEKHEKPIELQDIPEQNFVKDSRDAWQVPDPKNEAHLEQLRNRSLLKEFERYREEKARLKVVRTEALRAGFKDCWQKGDYTTIIQMAKRVPETVIQEDSALLMYYDNAVMRKGE